MKPGDAGALLIGVALVADCIFITVTNWPEKAFADGMIVAAFLPLGIREIRGWARARRARKRITPA